MYTIIQVGSTQVKVSEGDMVQTPRVKTDVGKDMTVDKVLLFAKGTDIRIGQPYLKDVKVTAKVLGHGLAQKVIAQKYRKRKNSATKTGNRQRFSTLNITKIAA